MIENKKETILAGLRQSITRIEAHGGPARGDGLSVAAPPLPDGFRLLAPQLFPGGAPAAGACHEIVSASVADRGAAAGFALALARMLHGHVGFVLWIGAVRGFSEFGLPYGPGLAAFGLDPDRVLVLPVRDAREALWAAEEALSCAALAAVLLELEGAPATLNPTALRRLKLRGAAHRVTSLLVRHGAGGAAGLPADLRWRVAAAASTGERHFTGPPAFHVALEKNRSGRTGPLSLIWEAHDGVFKLSPVSIDPAAAPAHRPPDAARTRRTAGGAA